MSALTMPDIQAAYHAESVALRIVGKTRETWSAFSLEAVTGGDEVKVAPFRLTKGGKKVYGSPKERVVMTEAQILDAAEQFEAEGKCAKCIGEGKVVQGWSLKEGTRHGPCPRCSGTGKAPR